MATVRFTGQQLTCATNNCQRIQPRMGTDRNPDLDPCQSVAYFFRVAAAFFAERERDAADRFFAALRA